jgi:uncharacterized CHY-type Zn-finger protein
MKTETEKQNIIICGFCNHEMPVVRYGKCLECANAADEESTNHEIMVKNQCND